MSPVVVVVEITTSQFGRRRAISRTKRPEQQDLADTHGVEPEAGPIADP